MKTEIMEKIGRLLIAVIMAVVLGGAVFALPVREIEKSEFSQSDKQKWTQAVEQFEKMSVQKNFRKDEAVSQINQANFMLGHYLMRTIYDAVFADKEGADYEAVIEDINVLLQAFEGKPEQTKLEELLKAVEEGTAGVEEITEIIGGIEESYRAELTEEEDWFLLYGEWTTCLIGDIYLEDDEYIFEDLQALDELAQVAPENVNEQITKPVGGLTKFLEQDGFSVEDYDQMKQTAFDIFDLVFSE